MTTQEHINWIEDGIIEDLYCIYGVQRRSDGSRYVNVPFPTEEEILERIESEMDNVEDALEDELPYEEEQRLLQICKDNVLVVYHHVAKRRIEECGAEDEWK